MEDGSKYGSQVALGSCWRLAADRQSLPFATILGAITMSIKIPHTEFGMTDPSLGKLETEKGGFRRPFNFRSLLRRLD